MILLAVMKDGNGRARLCEDVQINASLSGKFEKIRERETTITISFLSLIGEVDGG